MRGAHDWSVTPEAGLPEIGVPISTRLLAASMGQTGIMMGLLVQPPTDHSVLSCAPS